MAGSKGSTSTSTTTIPDWEQQDFSSLIAKSNNQTNADINSINYPQLLGQFGNATSNILNSQVNPKQLSAPIAQAGGASWTQPNTAQSYMNPYESTALQSQIGIDRNSLLQPELAQVDRNAAGSGALGGDRNQLERSQTVNNFNNTEANTVAQGMNSAYNTGLGAFNADANRNLQGQTSAAQTGLAGTSSNIYSQFAGTQAGLNQIAASEAPGQQVNQQAGILGALPHMGQTQTSTSPNGGMFGGIAGGILGGIGQLFLAKGGLVKKRK